MGFKLDPQEIGWAPYVMIGGGFGVGMLVFEHPQFSDQDLGARGFGGLARPALDRAAVSHALA